jgi:hypothetical protein
MNLPWSVWLALVCGVALVALARGGGARTIGFASAVLVWSALGLSLDARIAGSAIPLDDLARAGVGLAVLWSAGFGAGLTSPGTPTLTRWGWMWLAVGGLAGVSCGQDWLTMGLAWEIVRRSTGALCDAQRPSARDALWPSLGFWIAVVAWLFATGTLDLAETATVLQRSYAARDPEVSLGRPALIVQGAACLLVISTLAPCFSVAWESLRSPPDDAAVAAFTARLLAAVVLLARCCRDVFFGLEASLSGVLLVFAGAAYCAAVWLARGPSRLDRLWLGLGLWQLAVAIHWLLVMLLARTSIGGGFPAADASQLASRWLLFELLHAVVILTGATAAIRLAARDGTPPKFLEELRGRARDNPGWAALLLIPLASAIGLPGLCGGWLVFLRLITLWSLPQAGPNDTLEPHAGLIVLQIMGLVAWVPMASAALGVVRTLVWEPSWTTWESRGDGWSRIIALAATALLVTAGLAPQLWLQHVVFR